MATLGTAILQSSAQTARRAAPGRAVGRRRAGPRRGMTLVEVLVAMSILLVGIWGVARGFPGLLSVLREDSRRTQMTRLAQATSERLTSDPAGLPTVILGDPGAAPQTVPEDPDYPAATGNAPNIRDNQTWVMGERAILSAPAADNTSVLYYPVKIGRADPTVQARAAGVAPLEAVYADPSPDPVRAGCFYITPGSGASGGIVSVGPNPPGLPLSWPSPAPFVEVSYAWRDNSSNVHYVQREVVAAAGGQVAAATAAGFNSVVEGSFWGSALYPFDRVTPGVPPALPNEVGMSLDGVFLLFNPANFGQEVRVDYALLQENGTRTWEVWEDRVPANGQTTPDPVDAAFSLATIQLTTTGLGSPFPLLPQPPLPNTGVLVVDLVNGAQYVEGAGIVNVDVNHGRVTLRVPNYALGRPFRFFYRTPDDAVLTVLRAPETYYPAEVFEPGFPVNNLFNRMTEYGAFWWRDIGTDPNRFRILEFQPSSAGLTVSVDYTYGDPNNPQRVIGELHTISVPGVAGVPGLTLSRANVLSVVTVRGVSLKVRGWWREERGRLQYADVDTIVWPAPPG